MLIPLAQWARQIGISRQRAYYFFQSGRLPQAQRTGWLILIEDSATSPAATRSVPAEKSSRPKAPKARVKKKRAPKTPAPWETWEPK